jgi:ABC-type dipeptide/oligopeptide/nickel transport system permease subunit
MKFQKHSKLNETRFLGAIFSAAIVTTLAIVGGFYLSQVTGPYTYGIVDYIVMTLISCIFFFTTLPVMYHILTIMDETHTPHDEVPLSLCQDGINGA